MRQIKQYLAGALLFAGCLLGAAAARADVAPVMSDVTLGKADAPVTVIEYASLTCPHCAHFANDTFDKVKAAYIDTGKVKWIYRDFPLDEMALRAAMMARCGGADRYYGFIELIFKQQLHWVTDKDPLQALAQLGRFGGMSEEQFKACMANKDVENAVLQSRVNAQKEYGVDSTPTFIINGEKQAGALEFDDFAKAVDALLPAAAAKPSAPPAPSPSAPASAPPAPKSGSDAPPAAGMSSTTWIVGGIVVVVILIGGIAWFTRRKSAR
jgi:protein-disulfide isomerase